MMASPPSVDVSGDLPLGNNREQPVAALPSGNKRPMRRGMRLNRSASSSTNSQESQPKLDLFSGIHSSAATSAEDAIRRLTEIEKNDQPEREDSGDISFGRRKKRFNITGRADDGAFAPYRSTEEDAELRLTGETANSGPAHQTRHVRTGSRSPTPPPDFNPLEYAKTSNTADVLRNLTSTLGALRRSAPVESEILADVSKLPSVAVDNELSVKIRYKGGVHRMSMKQTARVAEVVSRFAADQGIASHLITLWRGDDTLAPDKTLQQAGVLLTDILDCSISSEAAIVQDGTLERNMVSLKVQDKSKSYVFCLGKGQQLAQLKAMYCEKSGQPANRVVLHFDGDKVNLEETPSTLDMDNDDVLDALLM